jgi:hypothetical protein
MSERLATELEQFAAATLAAQQHLLDLLRRKRVALAASDMPAVAAFQIPEMQAAEQLQAMLAWRAKLLERAQQSGHDAPTLTDLAHDIGAGGNTQRLLESSRRTARELQRESWVHWIITNRCAQYYRELIDRIAHNGKRAPTYEPVDHFSAASGTLLNATA